jgi:hypothetical protein
VLRTAYLVLSIGSESFVTQNPLKWPLCTSLKWPLCTPSLLEIDLEIEAEISVFLLVRVKEEVVGALDMHRHEEKAK